MSMRYIIHKKLIPENRYTVPSDQEPFAEILSAEEYRVAYPNLIPRSLLTRIMDHNVHCKADIFKHYILGALVTPSESAPPSPEVDCFFYLDREKLILITESSQQCERICLLFERIEQHQITDIRTPSQALFEFLGQLISNEEEFLDDYEQTLNKKEHDMTEDVNEIPKYFDQYILKTRKDLLLLTRYYRHLAQIGRCLSECPNEIVDDDAREMYRFFASRIERLSADAQNLREYSLQIRDMYQSRIDVKHNKIIQFLTIVTTIFMPLTLITGWYGMNFPGMPEFRWTSGYKFVILLASAIIIAEWIVFRKKKWL